MGPLPLWTVTALPAISVLTRWSGKVSLFVVEGIWASYLPLLDIIDPGKVFYKALYQALVGIGHWLWASVATLLATSWIIRSLDNWMATELVDFTDTLVGGFGPYLVAVALVAITLYGAATVLNSFFPNFKPVDAERLLIYFAIGAIYIGSASEVIGFAESLRSQVYAMVTEHAYSGISGVFSGGSIFDEAPLGMEVGGAMSSGWDTAIAYVGLRNGESIHFHSLPARLIEGYPYIHGGAESGCCFRFAGNGSSFDGMDDNERSSATYQALDGLRVLWFAHAPALFSIIEECARLLLTVAAYVVYFTIPIGFILSPFRLTAGVLGSYVNRYVALLAEVLLTAAFLGLGNALIVAALNKGLAAFMAAVIISFLIALWRALSAFKLTTTSLQAAVSSVTSIAGMGSALSFGDIQRMTTGSATGGALLAAGAATGNPALMLGGANQLSRAFKGSGIPGGAALAAGGMFMVRQQQKSRSRAAGRGGAERTRPSDALQPDLEAAAGQALAQGAAEQPAAAAAAARGAQRAGGTGSAPRTALRDEPRPTLKTPSPAEEQAGDGQAPVGRATAQAALAAESLPGPDRQREAQQDRGQAKAGTSHGRRSAGVKGDRGSGQCPLPGATDVSSLGWGGDAVRPWLRAIATAEDNMRETYLESGERRFGPAAKRAAAMAADDIDGLLGEIQTVEEYAVQYAAQHGEARAIEHFRSGDAFSNLALTFDGGSPLQDADNFGAIADLVLEPTRPVFFHDVMHAMAAQGKEWADPLEALATNLGMPQASFAGAGGTLRSVLNTAGAVGAMEAQDDGRTYLETAADYLAHGDHEAAENVLLQAAASAGVADAPVEDLLSDLAVAAAVFQEPRIVAQSVQFAPGDAQGRERYVQSQVNFKSDARHREQRPSLPAAQGVRETEIPGAAGSPAPSPRSQGKSNTLHR